MDRWYYTKPTECQIVFRTIDWRVFKDWQIRTSLENTETIEEIGTFWTELLGTKQPSLRSALIDFELGGSIRPVERVRIGLGPWVLEVFERMFVQVAGRDRK